MYRLVFVPVIPPHLGAHHFISFHFFLDFPQIQGILGDCERVEQAAIPATPVSFPLCLGQEYLLGFCGILGCPCFFDRLGRVCRRGRVRGCDITANGLAAAWADEDHWAGHDFSVTMRNKSYVVSSVLSWRVMKIVSDI